MQLAVLVPCWGSWSNFLLHDRSLDLLLFLNSSCWGQVWPTPDMIAFLLLCAFCGCFFSWQSSLTIIGFYFLSTHNLDLHALVPKVICSNTYLECWQSTWIQLRKNIQKQKFVIPWLIWCYPFIIFLILWLKKAYANSH